MAHKTADEYLIYAFSDYKANLFGQNKWRYVAKDTNPDICLRHARQLFTSNNYARVEVKKKSFNPKINKYNLSTYEVFGKNRTVSLYTACAVALLAFAVIGQVTMLMM